MVTSPQEVATQAHRRVVVLAPEQSTYRLPVVDDQPDNRRVLTALLQPVGFEGREAATGQDAITLWQQWQPHLIWMDLRMPDIYEVTQTIRNDEVSMKNSEILHAHFVIPDCKIIALSASGNPSANMRFLKY